MNMTLLRQYLLTATLLLFSIAALRGQGFVKQYGFGSCSALIQTADGGFFMAGDTTPAGAMFMQKVSATGVVEWDNPLSLGGAGAIAACPAPDGGFVVLTENYPDAGKLKNLVLKISPAGDIVWQTVVDNNYLPNGLRDIILSSDGQFLAAGDTRDATLNQNVRLVKFDANGQILWSQMLGDPALNEQVSSLRELPGGDIVVSGAGLNGTDRDFFLLRANASGNLVWQQWYHKPATQIAYDLEVLSDGSLVLLGDTYGIDPTKISLLKTDADGNELFYKQIFPWATDSINPLYFIKSFVRDDGDNLYIPGAQSNLFLLKLDELGEYYWIKPILQNPQTLGAPLQIIRTASNKFAIAGGPGIQSGSTAYLLITNEEGEVYTNKISGNIFRDDNGDCLQDAGEGPLDYFVVKAENPAGEVFYRNVSPDGSFLISVSEGQFSLSATPMYGTPQFWQSCAVPAVPVVGDHQTVSAPPLGIQAQADCPQMYVEIATPFLRRCIGNAFKIIYFNSGGTTATDVFVRLVLSSPDLQYQSSSVPLTAQSGDTLFFNLPDVPPGVLGLFSVTLSVDCEAVIGDFLCVEAHIFPDTICPAASAQWDGSHLEVTGECDSDVRFTIRNIGSGNMTGAVDYVIVEDQIMYMQGNVQLDAGEDTLIVVPNPVGGPYFLQTQQRPGHPGLSQPSALVSPCGGVAASSSLQFPNDEGDLFQAVHCDEVIASYDPNDKRGFPQGWQDAHYIERNQELEYMVRFQNTGNDTAFLVVIRDTLSPLLDASSVRPGPASHPYTFEVNDLGELVFRFSDILLIDSATNEPASHGFVMFSVSQRPDLPLGSVIENHAAIYFDYNEPVITNTTYHTVGQPFTTIVKDLPDNGIEWEAYPNPFAEEIRFHLNDIPADMPMRLSIFNPLGVLERDESFTGPDYRFRRNRLPAGLHFFRIESKGRLLASGRLIIAQ
ncbi:MAG: hypothetical protein H6565_09705 [Lewinellaceae bacterium]|nr:hypothetical protein [Lewinellaceae bacterium]